MVEEKRARQYYKTSKRYMDHEKEMALIRAFAADPELKYFVGMGAGAGIAWVGSFLSITDNPPNDTPGGQPSNPLDSMISPVLIPYGWLISGAQLGSELGESIRSMDFSGSSQGGLAGQMGNILKMGGTGFAGTCAMILILKSIFSGTDLGELLSGVGEIIPL